jgi:hypothetical protein
MTAFETRNAATSLYFAGVSSLSNPQRAQVQLRIKKRRTPDFTGNVAVLRFLAALSAARKSKKSGRVSYPYYPALIDSTQGDAELARQSQAQWRWSPF